MSPADARLCLPNTRSGRQQPAELWMGRSCPRHNCPAAALRPHPATQVPETGRTGKSFTKVSGSVQEALFIPMRTVIAG